MPIGAQLGDDEPEVLPDIDFDNGTYNNKYIRLFPSRNSYNPDDSTNLHRHARQNAQEAISLAKERALQFDMQAALERKTNEALKLAKAQAHIHNPSAASTSAPLVDCMCA